MNTMTACFLLTAMMLLVEVGDSRETDTRLTIFV